MNYRPDYTIEFMGQTRGPTLFAIVNETGEVVGFARRELAPAFAAGPRLLVVLRSVLTALEGIGLFHSEYIRTLRDIQRQAKDVLRQT